MRFVESNANETSILKYIGLFATCFPGATHYSMDYLSWLYRDNPAGNVVGFDAWDGDVLAAHYACVPVRLRVEGRDCRGLLSLNTATHPDYQGKGLFTKLAAATYDHGRDLGFECVYGVANANSTPGFVRKLGFQLVTPIDACVGIGELNFPDFPLLVERARFQRPWAFEELRWRQRNPANPVLLTKMDGGRWGAAAPTHRWGIYARAEVMASGGGEEPRSVSAPWRPRLFLGLAPGGLRPRGYVDIPQRLRPSPLNLIYRDLSLGVERIDSAGVLFSFLDFDAY